MELESPVGRSSHTLKLSIMAYFIPVPEIVDFIAPIGGRKIVSTATA